MGCLFFLQFLQQVGLKLRLQRLTLTPVHFAQELTQPLVEGNWVNVEVQLFRGSVATGVTVVPTQEGFRY